MVCEEGLVAGSSPLLYGAVQHSVSHPEELTLSFELIHEGFDLLCIIIEYNQIAFRDLIAAFYQ